MNPIALAFLQGAVGFGIGAGTNDLAIRWIFHAVFAKKKRAIAESVQEIISNELMTPEKIAARLTATDSIDALQTAIEKHLDVIFARDLPSLDKLAADSGGEMLVKEAADSVVNIAVGELAKRLPFPGVIRAPERRVAAVEEIQFPDVAEHLGMALIAEQKPVELFGIPPFDELAEFSAHEQQFFAGVCEHVSVQRPQSGEFLPDVARLFIQHAVLAVHDFIV